MWRRVRRHPILLSLAALALLALAGAAATGWYFLGEGRRAGRLVSTVLTSQTGLPVVVDGAAADGPQRLILYGLRVPPGRHWSGEIRVRELRVDGGFLPIVFPRGRALSVVAVSTSVTLPPAGSAVAPPTAGGLEALRRLLVEMIAWPADFSLDIQRGELRAGDDVVSFDLKGHKSGAGALMTSVTIAPSRNARVLSKNEPALAVRLAGSQTDGKVNLRMHLAGAPIRLGTLWPAALPAFGRLALDADLALPPGADVELTGRVEAARTTKGPAITSEFTSGYRADAGRLDLSSLSMSWGPDLRLAGRGRIEQVGADPRLTVEMSGVALATRLAGTLGFAAGSGEFEARIQTEAVDGRRLLDDVRRLLEMKPGGRPPVDLTARRTTSAVAGKIASSDIRLTVQSTLGGLEARSLFSDAAVEGTLGLGAVLRRIGTGVDLARLEPSTLTVSRAGAPLAVITARSRDRAAWPVTIEGTMTELSRLPASPALPGKYTGRATLTGTMDRARDGVQFAGQLAAELPRAEIDLGGPVVLMNTTAEVPVTWGVPASTSKAAVIGDALTSESAGTVTWNARSSEAAGTVFVEQVAGYGFTLERLLSSAQFRDGRLLLPDIKYVHYGGRGTGWLEAAIDGRAVPVRARLEGQHIDLARLTREYGLTVAEISGNVHYLFVLQYSPAQGAVVVGQVASDDGGGEVNIEAIEKLLASGQVQAEATGVLRQTLENLRVFRYASLTGDVRITRSGGYINLSLEGKKRLGIFPAPVQAINLRNVPIGLLGRLFARRNAP